MATLILSLLIPLNDISTDVQNPPEFRAVRQLSENQNRDYSFGEDKAHRQRKLYPTISGLKTPLAAIEVYLLVKQVLEMDPEFKQFFWSPQEFRVEAIAETSRLHFKDDVVIEVRDLGGHREIQIRSKSRVGKSDLGANAKRINRIFAQLQLNPTWR